MTFIYLWFYSENKFTDFPPIFSGSFKFPVFPFSEFVFHNLPDISLKWGPGIRQLDYKTQHIILYTQSLACSDVNFSTKVLLSPDF